MNIFLLPMGVATIYLSMNQTAVLHFQKPVTGTVGASNEEIHIQNDENLLNKRIFSINPKTKKVNTNLTIATSRRKYNFWLKYDEKKASENLNIYPGHPNKSYKKIKEFKDFIYYEGNTSTKIKNKKKSPIFVNGFKVLKERIFSRNVPLEITNQSTHLGRNPLIGKGKGN